MSRQELALIAFGLGIVVAPLGWVVTANISTPVIAQDSGSEDLIDIQQGERRFSREPVDDIGPTPNQDLVVIQPVDDQTNPLAEYLELAKQKAELLTPEELSRETQVLRQELFELQATLKLRKVEQQLQQLIDEHPESGAAQRAKTLLDTLRNPNLSTQTFGSPRIVPVPEDGFAPVQSRKRARDVEFDSFDPNRNNDPFSTPDSRPNAQPAQPNKKPVPGVGPNRT